MRIDHRGDNPSTLQDVPLGVKGRPRPEATPYSQLMTFRKLTCFGVAIGGAVALTACGGETEAEVAAPSTITRTVTTTVDHTTTVTETPEDEPEPTQASRDIPEPAPPNTGASGSSSTTFGAGTHLVGSDVQPGTYRNTATDGCYWERLSGTSGDFEDIITNGFSEGQSYVTIAPTDVAFNSSFCGTWELVE